ncbi:MAG: BolA family transcriptional regulator [Hyphomicrobiales bacterium]|nr:BolA family transcriptional regulator [Hyphomicrobiales bacterium]MDE2115679.1 BolA family transcriptional regulator [Hyphomicrobiales bacterium]
MNTQERITTILQQALKPDYLEVIDESQLHAGHSGSREGGQTHYRVKIATAAFQGQTRLACHRRIHELLAAELQDGVHALALETRAS